MGRLVVTEWISLDGFICGPEDDMSFVGTKFDAEMGAYEDAFVHDAEAVLLGRITYESFAGAWPARETDPATEPGEREMARQLNALPKYMISSSATHADWNNSQVINSLDTALIQRVKDAHTRTIAIFGSASIVRQLTDARLIDEYQLLVYPVLLGGGKRIFNKEATRTFNLTASRQFKSGVMLLTYSGL